MWLPLTSRVGLGSFWPTTLCSTSDTQGPAALTRARALISKRRAVAAVLEHQVPQPLLAPGLDAAGAGGDLGAAVGGVAGVENDEAGIVDPAVGILEGAGVVRLEGPAGRVAAEVEAAGRRQDVAAAEVVVKEEAEPDDRPRPQAAVVGEDEPQRPDDVGGRGKQHLALVQRLADQAELVELEVAQAAVDELGRGRGGGAGKVAHLGEEDAEAAALRVAGDAAPVHAAADHREIVRPRGPHRPSPISGHCRLSLCCAAKRCSADYDAMRKRRASNIA